MNPFVYFKYKYSTLALIRECRYIITCVVFPTGVGHGRRLAALPAAPAACGWRATRRSYSSIPRLSVVLRRRTTRTPPPPRPPVWLGHSVRTPCPPNSLPQQMFHDINFFIHVSRDTLVFYFIISFVGIVIRQIADLLWEYERVALPSPRMVPLAYRDALRLQCYLERQLKQTWDWLVTVMDATEAQLRYLFFLEKND